MPLIAKYRLTWRGRRQTGLAAIASLADYASNRIRKHELTTPIKEDDRVRQIAALNAQTGPVMLAYPAAPEIDAVLAAAAIAAADVDVVADYGVRHELWPITEVEAIARLTRAVDALPALYIADGHHRYETALNYRDELRAMRKHLDRDDAANFVLMALIDVDDPGLLVLPTHRLISHLGQAALSAL